MSWLSPGVSAAVAGSLLLFAVFIYIYRTQGRERHILLWAGAWALSGLRYALSLLATFLPEPSPPLLTALTYLSVLGATFLLLWGTHLFVGLRLARFWVAFTAVEALWVVAAAAARAEFLVLTLPVFSFVGATLIWTGVIVLRMRHLAGVGRPVLGWSFIIFGLHRWDYPFLRPVEWFAPWGFLLSSMLEVSVTIGMLLLHLEKSLVRLRESEQRYRGLIEGSPDAILVLRGGEVTYANAPAARLLEGELRERLPELAARTDAGVRPAELKVGDRDLEARVLPLDGAGAQVVVQDVTERRRLDERLREAAKMEAVGRLAGGVAHDFNNLLTGILGYASLILLETPTGDPRRASAEEIQRAGERAADLTRQLLAFARRQPVELRAVDVDAVVREATPLLQRLVGDGVRVAVRLEAGAARIQADPAQLELALVNLAVNARDAMPDGGALTISTRRVAAEALPGSWPGSRERGAVELSVSDTGVGMDAATRARVFEPFFTTKPKGKGTGLGLSTVHGIVSRGGGQIEVDTAPGRGTTFRILLPRTSASDPPSPSPALPGPPRAARGTILLVEDERTVRDMAARALGGAGYTVIACGDGEEALATASAHAGRIDLLLSDVVMPGATGVEVARRIRAARPDVRVLLMSGHAAEVLGPAGVPSDGTPLLPKPFTATTLVERVGAVLTG